MGIERETLIVITGATASGKSSLAVDIALLLKRAEIISADSRQIYREMDIGTGKITEEEKKNIPHHLLDIRNPEESFTVAEYKELAEEKIKEIKERGNTPILCGGTGFYIKAVVDGVVIPQVAPDEKLRKELEKKTKEGLFLMLLKIDKRRAESIEGKNKRKLIRALEIVKTTGEPVPEIKKFPSYPATVLCLHLPNEVLEKKIRRRVDYMIENNLEEEVKNIFKKNISLARESIGYAEWEEYFNKKISIEEVKERISINTMKYAKAQKKWFKKENYINVKNKKEAIAKLPNQLF